MLTPESILKKTSQGNFYETPDDYRKDCVIPSMHEFAREVAVHYMHHQLSFMYPFTHKTGQIPSEAYEAFDKWMSEQKER